MLDYKKIGLMSGIEIHRRLDTKKLFCKCSSEMKENPLPYEVRRTLNVAQSETGTVDIAVLHEKSRDKEFIYKIYPNETCLICMDEEPPKNVNSEAFKTSLEISLLLNCEIPDEIHTMRKIVIDGSNTSGFQRTALVGINGKLETSFGNVGITNVSLEEESAQILEEKDGTKIYGLNRLGIPLVEIGTSPDMHTPQQVREVAEKIGSLLKSTGKVKRGLGTIRQDVNVSIKGGARVEIKGAQDLKTLELLVEREAERQMNLLKLKEDIHLKAVSAVHNVSVGVKKEFLGPVKDLSPFFENSESSILKGKKVHGFCVPHFSGYFKKKISGERTLGNEIANYAKIKVGIKGFIHSDENLEKYKITTEFFKIGKAFETMEDDLIVVLAADKEITEKTRRSIEERILQLFVGVPEETRKALPDATSEYMRPLPGAARMYPETDVPPIHVSQKELKEIEKNLPESLEEKQKRFMKEYKLNEELARQMVNHEKLSLFEHILDQRKGTVSPKDLAVKILGFDSFLEKEHIQKDDNEKDQLLEQWFINAKEDPAHFFDYVKFGKVHHEKLDIKKVEQFAEEYIRKQRDSLSSKPENARVNVVMGPLMAQFKGGILTGHVASEIAKKKLKEAGL